MWYASPTVTRGSGWGVVNAFSEYEQWIAPVRKRRSTAMAERAVRGSMNPLADKALTLVRARR